MWSFLWHIFGFDFTFYLWCHINAHIYYGSKLKITSVGSTTALDEPSSASSNSGTQLHMSQCHLFSLIINPFTSLQNSDSYLIYDNPSMDTHFSRMYVIPCFIILFHYKKVGLHPPQKNPLLLLCQLNWNSIALCWSSWKPFHPTTKYAVISYKCW